MAKPAHVAAAPVAPEPIAAGIPTAAPAAAAPRFAIEDNIPFPVKRNVVKGTSIYPFADLNVGQTFRVPSTPEMPEPWKTLTSMSSRFTREMHPKVFVTAREKDANGVEGVRIWRKPDTDAPLSEPIPRRRKAKGGTATEGTAPGTVNEAGKDEAGNKLPPEPDFN